MAIHRTMKCLALKRLTTVVITSALCLSLGGCFGGSMAQLLVRSIFIQGADKVTAAAIEAKEQNDKLAIQKMPRKDTPPDPYQIAFLNAAFENVPLQVEPLPEKSLNEATALPVSQEIKIIESKLIQVEVWNLLAGEEKQSILEKARIQGVTNIPPNTEWQKWQIAVGAENKKTTTNKLSKQEIHKTQPITFLIPPEIGKMFSGEIALVELSSVGEFNIARYALN
ncbi:MAG TPA: hypothetical protein VES38_01010 [Methylotenera sp.]|nr:hypothetical protein [Methylotenera sp.]